MAVAHLFSLSGTMANPFEFRELMKAQFQLNTDKTVEQVQAEQEQRHRENARPNRARGTSSTTPAAPAPGVVRQSEMDKLRLMLERGKRPEKDPPE